MANQPTEIGTQVQLGDLLVNYHDVGEGDPVFLIHGSGPGVSAWANWRTVLPKLAERGRIIAPDMMGFGYTEAPKVEFDLDVWVGQVIDLADHLGLDRFAIVGNSYGGALALHVALRHPERISKLVLMGAVSVPFEITDGLDAVWGYQPDLELMGRLMRDVFVYDGSAIGDDLVQMRYEASTRPTVAERFSALFPAPRQRWVDALAPEPEELASLNIPTLLVHGRDDKVIPLSASDKGLELLPDAKLEVMPECGHWVQIEQNERFCRVVSQFLFDNAG